MKRLGERLAELEATLIGCYSRYGIGNNQGRIMRHLIIAAMAVSLFACATTQISGPRFIEKASPEQKAAAQERVKQVLKDPDSAQFRNMYLAVQETPEPSTAVCGEVNSKNSYGGYAGYTQFVVDPKYGAQLLNTHEYDMGTAVVHQICVKAQQR